ncbi:hypothetical protein E2C01_090571 [Portunus trituberculatus]|uniref:Uncharacterized protein n=1 Tax=Portunus trituberculatus TaxID=210409 RepID=A0A5B7JSS3_PORTR|nr:hypothetical protein [Portunus trituberculatus]
MTTPQLTEALRTPLTERTIREPSNAMKHPLPPPCKGPQEEEEEGHEVEEHEGGSYCHENWRG